MSTVVERGPNFTKLQIDPATRALIVGENINYRTPDGEWAESIYAWEPSPHPSADLQIIKAPFNVYSRLQFGSERQIRFSKRGDFVDLSAMPIYYRSRSGVFKEMMPMIMNQATVNENELNWATPYGNGSSLKWQVSSRGVAKWLTISAPSFWADGGTGFKISTTVEVPFRMYTSLGLNPKIGGALWDGLTDTESDEVVFNNGLEDTIKLDRPYYVDANGDIFYGRYRIRKLLTNVIISSSFSLTELRNAAYPITIDPSFTQDVTALANHYYAADTSTYSNNPPRIGHISTIKNHEGILRFTGITIPAGATITVARLRLGISQEVSATLRPLAQVGLDDGANAAMPTTYTEFSARAKTWSTMTAWPMTEAVGATSTSTSWHDIMQAKVNQSGWASGNAIVVYIRDTRPTTDNDRILTYGYAAAAGLKPNLYIEYAEAVPVPPTPTGLTATMEAALDRVKITWNAATNATGYKIYVQQEGGTDVVTNLGNVLTINHTSGVVGKRYRYAVDAYNTSGTSAKSAYTAYVMFSEDDPPILSLATKGR